MPSNIGVFVPNPVPPGYTLGQPWSGRFGNLTGHGSPEGAVIGWRGYTFVDEDTGDIYKKRTGDDTVTGWEIITAGGAGTEEIAEGAADPVGAPAAGVKLFRRTDIVRVLSWQGGNWEVVASV